MSDAAPITVEARRPGARTVRGFQLGRYAAPLGFALAAATIGAGIVARATGEYFGAPLAPFFSSWDPQFAVAALAPAVLVVLILVAVPALLSNRLPAPGFAAASFAVAMSLAFAFALARGGGIQSLSTVFGSAPESANEYLPALPALGQGVAGFLDRFAEIAPTLPVHPSAHPPGLLVAIDLLGIDTATGLAALVIVAGALTAPLTYLLARQLIAEQSARVAALCWCFSPAALLYVATSADALFAMLGTAAAAALVARRRVAILAGAALLALASFFAYSLLAAGTWAGVVLIRRDGLRRAVMVGTLCAATLTAFYGVLHLATGFDPFGAVAAAHDAYTLGIARSRPYAYWLFGSPVAFLLACGIPVMWFALRALGGGQAAAVGLAGIVLTAAVLGFTKAETERIWLFMVPFACIAAATWMPQRWLRPALALMAAQALAVQVLTVTVW